MKLLIPILVLLLSGCAHGVSDTRARNLAMWCEKNGFTVSITKDENTAD